MKKLSVLLALLIALTIACEEDNNEPDNSNEENPELVATYSTTNVSEYGGEDGSISVNVTSGTKPYSYKLNDNSFQTNNTFNGLKADTFDVSVKDATDQLLVFNDIIITEPTLDEITLDFEITNVSVYGGEDGRIIVNASGGLSPYSYKLNDGNYNSNDVYENLSAGDYIISVKDDIDSVKIDTVTITEPEYIEMTVDINVTDVSINGGTDGSITVNVEGGVPSYLYELSNGVYTGGDITNYTFENLSANTYTLTVTDQYETIIINDIVIEQPDELIAGTATETDMGEITVSGTTGGVEPYQYSIDDGNSYQSNNIFTELNADTYTVKIKDASNVVVETNSVTLSELSVGDEYLGGVIFEINGTYPNQTGKKVKNLGYLCNYIEAEEYINNINSNDNVNEWRIPNIEEIQKVIILHKEDNNFNLSNVNEHGGFWSNDNCEYDHYTVVSYNDPYDEHCTYITSTTNFIPVSNF